MKNRIAITFAAVVALVLVLICAPQLRAQDVSEAELDHPFRPGARATYRDLARLALPDLTDAGKLGHTVYVRDGWLMNEASTYDGEMELTTFRGSWVKTPRGKRLVLFLQLEGNANQSFTWGKLSLLAIVDPLPQPKLLDLVDVGGDRTTNFWGTLDLGPRNSAVVIAYEHHNAGENYRHHVFLQVDEGQVGSLFDGFPYLYYGRTTGREIAEEGDFFAQRGANPRHRDLVFNLETTVTRYRADDEAVRSKRKIPFRLRAVWRRGRYRFADGGAELKRMMAERKRVGFG